jgi:hypothetical protein
MKIALRINCHEMVGGRCEANHPKTGPTPDATACAICRNRIPLDDRPAVDWTEVTRRDNVDEVAICPGKQKDFTVDAWAKLYAGKLRWEGSSMIVPRALFDAVRAMA